MVEQDVLQVLEVLRFEQLLDGASRQLGEGLVGRSNTVKGPAPLRVSTNPAAWTAVTNVVKRPSATAVSTMSLGVGVAVGGTTVAVGVAADVPHAANTSDVNNTMNNKPI